MLVCLCASVAISKRAYLATEKDSAIRGGNKRGLILMDCHRKIPVKTTLGPPPLSLCLFREVISCPVLGHAMVPVPDHLAGIGLTLPPLSILFSPRHRPQRSVSLSPRPTILPMGIELRREVCPPPRPPPLRSPKIKLLLVSLPFATVILNLFFCCCLNLRAQQWGESLALPGPQCQARGRVERCGWRGVGWGYVSSLGSGLLTGLPPFMTTGSLVVLLEGGPPASLGTASPTSCNEGSRYIATGGGWG